MRVNRIPKKLLSRRSHVAVPTSSIIQKINVRKTAVSLRMTRAMNALEIVDLRAATALLIVFLQHPHFLGTLKILFFLKVKNHTLYTKNPFILQGNLPFGNRLK